MSVIYYLFCKYFNSNFFLKCTWIYSLILFWLKSRYWFYLFQTYCGKRMTKINRAFTCIPFPEQKIIFFINHTSANYTSNLKHVQIGILKNVKYEYIEIMFMRLIQIYLSCIIHSGRVIKF